MIKSGYVINDTIIENMPNKKGKFIVFEGLDGSGKTEMINRLKVDYPDFIYTREPGGSLFGEALRQVLLGDIAKEVPPKAMLLGFMSARSSHVDELIVPALEKQITVVSDRCDGSSFAFQLYGQNNLDLTDFFWDLRRRVFSDLTVHYIYLRITPEVADARRKNRTESNHFDLQEKEYHERVFKGYEVFFDILISGHITGTHVHGIDATPDKDIVYASVRSCVDTLLRDN